MASSSLTRGGASAPLRGRKKKRTWKQLFEQLIGKEKTQQLIKDNEVNILIQRKTGLRVYTLLLREQVVAEHRQGHYFCIHARQAQHKIPDDHEKLKNDEEHNLSLLYPKVAFLIARTDEFFYKAG